MPLVIPIFIPHEGCPHACVFCNQHRISGIRDQRPVTPQLVAEIIEEWLERGKGNHKEVQVAFYGGSFTGLPEARQEELLAAVHPFLEEGLVQTLRLSTRPDCVDLPVIDRLLRHRVTIVELGVQSLDPLVLSASSRGHGAGEVAAAARLLRDAGLQVGMQLMIGLPGQTFFSLRRTVRQVIRLRPDFVRIYPVLVLKGSRLADLQGQGCYRPLPLYQAVGHAAWMNKVFVDRGIRVVRMGLQPGPELERALLAGPYHPAFGEMVLARLMLQRTVRALRAVAPGTRVTLTIAERDNSVFRGIGSANMNRLRQLGLLDRFKLRTDPDQPRATLRKNASTGETQEVK